MSGPILPTDKDKEPGYKVTDNVDGDITNKVRIFESYNKVIYFVEDLSGNYALAEREVIREDLKSPLIELTKGDSITICKDIPFEEPGLTAADNSDEDITNRVIVNGYVNYKTVGTYESELPTT